ncbi:hypothetical protein [Rhizobium tumorigenes]|uniref:hypothetical protein n=1 Tax=Rhizobium tumorigenes TaxID=2041385 RepID=UPI00241DCC9D|nr:hypothetical protein [Rhizobium tumorigenes]WFS03063.1 hypothetical protein PR016_20510 [Rhizobium tumorigenes]
MSQYVALIPPSDPSHWQRTAILAVSEGGHDGFRHRGVYTDLKELVEYLANGTFPEQGDTIYISARGGAGLLKHHACSSDFLRRTIHARWKMVDWIADDLVGSR